MPSVLDVTAKITADTSGFTSGVQQAESALSGLESQGSGTSTALESIERSSRASALMDFGDRLTQQTAALGQFTEQAVASASDINEAGSAVATVYGQEAAPIIQDFAEGAAANLGMTENQALSASAQLGAMFTSMGLGATETANMSTELLQASADLGSFHNAMPIEAMEAMRAGLIGEAEPLRRFGILLSADAIEAKGLEMGLGDVNGEMSEGEKVQARYALIMEQLGAAQGDFARTSTGLANATRINQAAYADLQAEIGQNLLPVQLQMMEVQSKLILGFSNLPPQLQAAGAMAAFAASKMGPMVTMMGQMALAGPKVAELGPKLIGGLFSPLGIALAIGAGLFLAYQTNFLGFGDAVRSFMDKLQPVIQAFSQLPELFQGAIGDGLNPLSAAFSALSVVFHNLGLDGIAIAFQNVARVAQQLGDSFAAFRESGLDPVQAGLAALNQIFPQVNGVLEVAWDLWNNLKETLAGVADGLRSAFEALTAGDWAGVLSGIGQAAQAALGGFIDSLGIIGGAVLQAFQNIDWGAVSGALQSGLQGLSTAVMNGLAAASQWFIDAFNQVDWSAVGATVWAGLQTMLSGLGDLAGLLVEKGGQLVGGLIQGIIDHFPNVNSTIDTQSASIADAIPGALTMLLQKGADLIAGLVQGIGDHIPDVTAKLGEIATELTNAIPDALTLLQQKGSDLITGLRSGIDAVWPGLSSWFQGLGTLIQTEAGEFASLLESKGSDLITGLKTGIDVKWAEVQAWLGTVSSLVTSSTLTDALTLLQQKGTELLTGLKSGIDSMWTGTVLPWLQSMAGLISEGVGSLAETLVARGTEAMDGLRHGAQDLWNNTLLPWFQSIPQLIADGIGPLAETLVAKGQEAMDGLRHGAQDTWNNVIIPWVQGLPAALVSAFGALGETLVSAGSEVIGGFLRGMQSAWQDVLSWVGGLTINWPSFSAPSVDMGGFVGSVQDGAQGAINAITGSGPEMAEAAELSIDQLAGATSGALEATSPSKLMYRIFQSVPQGAALAILDGVPLVEQAATEVVEATSSTIEDGLRVLAQAAGPQFVQNLSDTLADGAVLMMDAAGHIVDQFGRVLVEDFTLVTKDITGTTTTLWTDWGATLGVSFTEGVQESTPMVQEASVGMADAAMVPLAALPTRAYDAATDTVIQMAGGLVESAPILTEAAVTVTGGVTSEFSQMRADIIAIVNDILAQAGVARQAASSVASSTAAIDSGGGGGSSDTGKVRIRDKGGKSKGKNASASGGEVTTGNIEGNADVSVDVSGGTAEDRSGKGKSGRGGGGGGNTTNNTYVTLRDDRSLERNMRRQQRQNDLSQSRGRG